MSKFIYGVYHVLLEGISPVCSQLDLFEVYAPDKEQAVIEGAKKVPANRKIMHQKCVLIRNSHNGAWPTPAQDKLNKSKEEIKIALSYGASNTWLSKKYKVNKHTIGEFVKRLKDE